jgi:recombination protein RecT
MSTQLAAYQNYAFGDLKPEDIITIKETIAKDCNDSQFRLFMSVAKAADANPLLSEIHPSVFSGKLTWQFGIEFFVRKAKETDGYFGHDVQLIHDNHTFKRIRTRSEDGRYFDDIVHESEGRDGAVVAGYAFAYKKGFPPFMVYMDVEEVEHYKRSAIGMQKTMWTNNFNDMFKKHMLKRALKAAFGIKFDDASSSSDSDESPGTIRKDITSEATETPSPSKHPEQPIDVTPDPVPPSSEDERKALSKQLKSKLDVLGVPSNKDGATERGEYYKLIGFEFFDPTNPSEEEIKKLLRLLEMKIAEKVAADDEPL